MNFDLNNFMNEIRNRQFVKADKKWTVGLSFTYFSGQPITLPSSVYIVNSAPDWEYNLSSIALYPSVINQYRLPYYARLDFNLNYEVNYGTWSLAPYLQIFNLLNRKNVWFIRYENEIKNGRVEMNIKNVSMIPILPSIGITIKF